MAIVERTPPARNGQPEMQPLRDDLRDVRSELRSLGASLGDIAGELRILAMKEADLAQAEMADSKSAATRAGIFGAVAAIVGLFVLGFLALTLMYALDTFMPQWLAALTTAVILAFIAALAASLAMRHLREVSITPKRTLQSIREDVKWAREQIKRNAP